MTRANPVKASLRRPANGDDPRFYAIANPVAPRTARSSHGKFAQEPHKPARLQGVESLAKHDPEALLRTIAVFLAARRAG